MATTVMAPPSRKLRSSSPDPTPSQIIASARSAPARGSGPLRLGLLTSAALWTAFTPLGWAPMAWVALVPLMLLVKLKRPTRLMYSSTLVSGGLFWLVTLQWMRLGDPTMYVAWFALSLYLACYFPLFVGLTRVAHWRLKVPLLVAAPAVWTGLEYVRAYALTGFSWYQLGHSQAAWLSLIQISDVVGAYGVSWLVAMGNAAIVELIPNSYLGRWQLLPLSGQTTTDMPDLAPGRRKITAVALLVVFGVVLGYGVLRRSQARFTAGPRVAALQGNFTASARSDEPADTKFLKYRSLTGQAIKEHADLIVWPEVMFPYPLFFEPQGVSDAELQAMDLPPRDSKLWDADSEIRKLLTSMSRSSDAALVIGAQAVTAKPKLRQIFNSAVMVDPKQGIGPRYDKQHRVPFGEYIPLADALPFLSSFTPYRGEFGIQAGTRGVAFEYNKVRYTPIICFEDTVPHVVRRSVNQAVADDPSKRKVDVLLNLSNDGWFHGSSEHDQHLITAAFRCVELRTPMVRAVNTGVSAIIDGDGGIQAKAVDPKTKQSKLVEAVVCAHVPLDNRRSLYLAGGDWFAQLCLALCMASLALGSYDVVGRRRVTAAPTPVSA